MNDKIKVTFTEDPEACGIEVNIRANKRSKEIDALIKHISAAPQESLMVKDKSGSVVSLLPADIITVSVNDKYLRIITEKDQFSVRQTLRKFEGNLDKGKFVRISRYELVNVDKIIDLDFTLVGTLRVELAGGMETWASRRSIPIIKARLSKKEGYLC